MYIFTLVCLGRLSVEITRSVYMGSSSIEVSGCLPEVTVSVVVGFFVLEVFVGVATSEYHTVVGGKCSSPLVFVRLDPSKGTHAVVLGRVYWTKVLKQF